MSRSSWATPTAAIARARSAASPPETTHPTGSTIPAPHRAKPARARSASRTRSASTWASRKIRDDPAERSPITAERSKHTTSTPSCTSLAAVANPTTPAPTTAIRTRGEIT